MEQSRAVWKGTVAQGTGTSDLNAAFEEKWKNLFDIIHLTEDLSVKFKSLKSEDEIFSVIIDGFEKSKVRSVTIALLNKDRTMLKLIGSTLPHANVMHAEKSAGIQIRDFCLKLSDSRIYSTVVNHNQTVHVKVSDLLSELFPRPPASAIRKYVRSTNNSCIISPLRQYNRCIGAFSMSSMHSAEYLIPTVRTFAGHISVALELARENIERTKAEEALKTSQGLLQTEREALKQKNIALSEVLHQIEAEKNNIKHQIATNVQRILLPTLAKLRRRGTGIEKQYLNLLENNLREITSPFLDTFAHKYSMLSTMELEVCNLVRNGLSSKEIADLLCISILTVHRHREFIRKKIGIINKKINLESYLKNLPNSIDVVSTQIKTTVELRMAASR
jgi:DNA-binding CsgD family transcriptional regulator